MADSCQCMQADSLPAQPLGQPLNKYSRFEILAFWQLQVCVRILPCNLEQTFHISDPVSPSIKWSSPKGFISCCIKGLHSALTVTLRYNRQLGVNVERIKGIVHSVFLRHLPMWTYLEVSPRYPRSHLGLGDELSLLYFINEDAEAYRVR